MLQELYEKYNNYINKDYYILVDILNYLQSGHEINKDELFKGLKNRLRDLNNQLSRSLGDKGDLDNQVQKLRNINKAQNNLIHFLIK